MEIECPGSAAEIYGKLKTKFEVFQKSSSIGQYIKEVKFNDNTHSVVAAGAGFKANIQCKDGKILADLDLNFLLRPMRAKIEEGIKKNIGRALS